MNSDLMMFSRGKKWSPRSGMRRDKYDHLLDKPWVKAAKAACGCVVAIAESSGESMQYPALRKLSRNWAFSTPEATWEVQARVQRLPLSKLFHLAFSFLFHGCELRNTCNPLLSSPARAVYKHGITRTRGV